MAARGAAMRIPTGDYLIEALDHRGCAIPGAVYTSASYHDSQAIATSLAEAHGTSCWRIMRCVANHDDKERWDVPANTTSA
jgi:hypothetical protein